MPLTRKEVCAASSRALHQEAPFAKPLVCPKKMCRPRSAPAIRSTCGAAKGPARQKSIAKAGSPLRASQPLVTVDVSNRCWYRQAVGQDGQVNFVSGGKLPLAMSERGLEYEHFGIEFAREQLPSLQVVLDAVRKEFDMSSRHLRSKHPKPATAGRRRKQLKVAVPQVERGNASGSSSFALEDKSAAPRSSGSRIRAKACDSQPSPGRDGGCALVGQENAEEEREPETESEPPEEAVPTESCKKTALRFAANLKKQPTIFCVAKEAFETRLIPWDYEQLHKAFHAFSDSFSHEVHCDDLRKVLSNLGIIVDASQVESIVQKQTHYSTIDFEEFKEFLRNYRMWEIIQLQRLFEEADFDGNGSVGVEELYKMVLRLGYHTTWNTVLEMHLAFGRERHSNVTYEEFDQVLHHLRSTSGIGGQELEALRDCFARLTAVTTGKELNAEDIWRLLVYSSYPAKREDVRRLMAKVDENGNGLLSFYEFLKLYRMYRDSEFQGIACVVRAYSKPGENAIEFADLGLALGDIGYYVAPTSFPETLDALGELLVEDFLTAEELQLFLRLHRHKEGFNQRDVREIRYAFSKGGGTDDSGLGVLGLGQAMRWLGFGMTLQERQKCIHEVDLDSNGTLEFDEFLKLLRRLHDQETSKRRTAFRRYVSDPKGRLPFMHLSEVLKKVNGSAPNEELLSKAISKFSAICSADDSSEEDRNLEDADIHEFDYLCEIYRRLEVRAARKHAGYTSKEIEKLRKHFQFYDRDNSGTIERSELRMLLTASFPEATRSAERRRWVEQLLKHVDADGNGMLDFEEFLWLMREADDTRDAADMAAEENVVAEVGISTEDAEGFREIFCECANSNGEIVLTEVMSLLRFADFSNEQLEAIVKRVAEVKTPGREGIRFPEFLRLLQRLYEDKDLGVQQASLRLVRQERLQQQRMMRSLKFSSIDRDANSAPARRSRVGIGAFAASTRRSCLSVSRLSCLATQMHEVRRKGQQSS